MALRRGRHDICRFGMLRVSAKLPFSFCSWNLLLCVLVFPNLWRAVKTMEFLHCFTISELVTHTFAFVRMEGVHRKRRGTPEICRCRQVERLSVFSARIWCIYKKKKKRDKKRKKKRRDKDFLGRGWPQAHRRETKAGLWRRTRLNDGPLTRRSGKRSIPTTGPTPPTTTLRKWSKTEIKMIFMQKLMTLSMHRTSCFSFSFVLISSIHFFRFT